MEDLVGWRHEVDEDFLEEWVSSLMEQEGGEGETHCQDKRRVHHIEHSIRKEAKHFRESIARLRKQFAWRTRRRPPSTYSQEDREWLSQEGQRIGEKMVRMQGEMNCFRKRVTDWGRLLWQDVDTYQIEERRLAVALLDSHGNIRDLTPLQTIVNQELGLAQGNEGQAGPSRNEHQANVEEGAGDSASSGNSMDGEGLVQHDATGGHMEEVNVHG